MAVTESKKAIVAQMKETLSEAKGAVLIGYSGLTVAQATDLRRKMLAEGVEYKVGNFPMRALGRSRASGDTDGFVKLLADAKTDEILGFHMIGARAADLVAEGVTAMEFRASAEDLTRMSHAHPTYAEAVKEAALDATVVFVTHVTESQGLLIAGEFKVG